jgi:hypothetical protein
MPTIPEVRKIQDEKLEHLRRLQRDKAVAPAERKEGIQKEIDAVSKEITNLDTVMQGLLNEARPKP